MKHLLNVMNTPVIAIVSLAAFLALASYSRNAEPGYTPQEVQSLNELIERETSKPVSALSMRQARAYAEVYGITDAAKPVMIFGAKAR